MVEKNKFPTTKKLVKMSKETRRKLSETHKKIVHTPEWNKNVSKALKGRKLTKKWKEKIRKSHLGKMMGKTNPAFKHGKCNTREMQNFYENRRRAKKSKNGGYHTFDDWQNLKAQYNWTCPSCKRSEPEIKLSEDHIIPISRGGSDNIQNIQPLCKSCNYKKYNKTILYER